MSTTNVARDAFDAFHSGDNLKCGQLLETITNCKGSFDVKVAHNTLVNDYYKSGCSDPQLLLTQLAQAHDKARERDKKDKGRRKKDEEDEAYREDEDLGVLRYNQALLCLQLRQHGQATLILEELFENIEPIDDFLAIKICFLLLELCLLQREPEQAQAVLAYLEKPNAFLTVLRSDRSATKLEQANGEGEVAGESSKGDGASEGEKEIGGVEVKTAINKDPAEAEGPLPSLTVGAFLPRHGRAPDMISRAEYRFFCHMYRARLAVMLKNTKAAKKDAKSALEILEQELRQAPLLAPHPHTTGAVDGAEEALRDGLHGQHHAMVNVLKAYLEYTRQNVRKAMKLLTRCQFNFAEGSHVAHVREDQGLKVKRRGSGEEEEEDPDPNPTDCHPAQSEACAPVFFNNLGCIHFMMHKPSLAAFYFQKAFGCSGKKTSDNLLGGQAGLTLPGVLATRHWLDRRAEVAYNAGLQLLMCEQPGPAYKCFEQCAPVFRTWPRLWIRLAECCIEMHRQALAPACSGVGEAREGQDNGAAIGGAVGSSSSPEWRSLYSKSSANGSVRQLLSSIQGSGEHRRWLLTTTRSLPIGKSSEVEKEPASDGLPSGDGALTQAAMCLRNVLVLTAPMLPGRGNAGAVGGAGADGTVEEASGAAPGARTARASASSGSPPKARDLLEGEAGLLEDAALVKLSFVCLCLRDHSGALRHSRHLLEKNGLLPQSAAESSAKESSQAEEVRRQWTIQAQSLTQTPGAAGSGVGASTKCQSSVGTVTLAVLYAAEALLLSGRPTEARILLGSFVTGNVVSKSLEVQNSLSHELERASVVGSGRRGSSQQSDERARSVCGGLSPLSPMGGLTPLGYLLHSSGSNSSQADREKGSSSKDGGHAALVVYPPAEMPRLGDSQCMLYTNLAGLHAQDGNLEEAERCCEKALQVQPHALAPLRTLVYILLRRGNHAEALRRLKQNRLSQPSR